MVNKGDEVYSFSAVRQQKADMTLRPPFYGTFFSPPTVAGEKKAREKEKNEMPKKREKKCLRCHLNQL